MRASGFYPDIPEAECACGCGETVRPGRSFRRGHNGRRPLSERFWEKVERTDACWLWRGSLTAGGYGHLRAQGDSFEYAHRVAYSLAVGPIPLDSVIDHLCRVRHCVNPAHLEPVSHRTNVIRGMAPYGVRTTCKHGHDITDPANVYTAPKGDRRCRTCAALREAERRRAS